MEQLKELRSVSDTVLDGLKADDVLRQRVLAAVSSGTDQNKRKNKNCVSSQIRWMRFVPAVCCAAAVLLVAVIIGTDLRAFKEEPVINSFTAGVHKSSPIPIHLLRSSSTVSEGIDDVPVSVTGIWSPKKNGYFPLVRINGMIYRQIELHPEKDLVLTDPVEIACFTDVPALFDSGINLSNLLPQGTAVHSVAGCNHAFAVAKLEDEMIVFQRSSLFSDAVSPGETIADTLPDADRIISVMNEKGESVSDPAKVKELFEILTLNAVYKGSNMVSGDRYILFRLDNGLSYQFQINGSLLSACGTWSCPELIDELETAFK